MPLRRAPCGVEYKTRRPWSLYKLTEHFVETYSLLNTTIDCRLKTRLNMQPDISESAENMQPDMSESAERYRVYAGPSESQLPEHAARHERERRENRVYAGLSESQLPSMRHVHQSLTSEREREPTAKHATCAPES